MSIFNPPKKSLKAEFKNKLIEKVFSLSGNNQKIALLLVKNEFAIGPNIKKIIKKNIK